MPLYNTRCPWLFLHWRWIRRVHKCARAHKPFFVCIHNVVYPNPPNISVSFCYQLIPIPYMMVSTQPQPPSVQLPVDVLDQATRRDEANKSNCAFQNKTFSRARSLLSNCSFQVNCRFIYWGCKIDFQTI